MSDGGKPVTFKKLGNLQLSITFRVPPCRT